MGMTNITEFKEAIHRIAKYVGLSVPPEIMVMSGLRDKNSIDLQRQKPSEVKGIMSLMDYLTNAYSKIQTLTPTDKVEYGIQDDDMVYFIITCIHFIQSLAIHEHAVQECSSLRIADGSISYVFDSITIDGETLSFEREFSIDKSFDELTEYVIRTRMVIAFVMTDIFNQAIIKPVVETYQ